MATFDIIGLDGKQINIKKIPNEVPVHDRKIKYHTQEDLGRFFMMLYTTGPPRDYALFWSTLL